MVVEHQLGVDLVADHHEAVVECQPGEGLQLVAAPHPTGGVVRVHEQHHAARPALRELGEVVEVGLPAVLGADPGARDHLALQRCDLLEERRVARGLDRDPVPRLGQVVEHERHGLDEVGHEDHPGRVG